ncbi:MAG: hypothetical protein ACOY32_16665 [Thermodesulfobacteriota bacterium]
MAVSAIWDPQHMVAKDETFHQMLDRIFFCSGLADVKQGGESGNKSNYRVFLNSLLLTFVCGNVFNIFVSLYHAPSWRLQVREGNFFSQQYGATKIIQSEYGKSISAFCEKAAVDHRA